MEIPRSFRYSIEHEWAALEPDGQHVRVGITDYAQDALGDVVHVQLPAVGARVQENDSVGEVESTKSVSEIYSPLAGVVVRVNDAAAQAPELVNQDPYGAGWLFVLEPDDLGDMQRRLMDADDYGKLLGG
jgi:glycine cleavage system H protein